MACTGTWIWHRQLLSCRKTGANGLVGPTRAILAFLP